MKAKKMALIFMILVLLAALLTVGCSKKDETNGDDVIPGSSEENGSETSAVPLQNANDANASDEINELIVDQDALEANESANATGEESNLTLESLIAELKNMSEEKKSLKVSFINVKHGNSIFIQTPNNKTMVIDGGGDDQGGKIMHYMRDCGVQFDIDAMMATNPSEYNVGGLDSILFNMANVGEVYDNGNGTVKDQAYLGFYEFGRQKGNFNIVTKDQTVPIDEEIEINLMIPYMDGYLSTLEDNSIVTKIKYGQVSFLFMSDCTAQCEEKMLGRDLKADIIKIAHYAWNDSTSQKLLDEVKPKVAIISTGDFNGFEPPSKDVLKRLADNGIEVWRTDQNGTIVVETDGSTYSVKALG